MKVVIIEDEIMAMTRLSRLLLEIDPTIEVVRDFDSIETSVEWLKTDPEVDLFFFDIHLADGSSFDIFQHVEISKPVIFITAYDQYALDAFRVSAIDYLLKPIKKTELEKALNKYRQWQQSTPFDYKELAKAMRPDSHDKRFLIRFGQTIRVVDIHEVAYFFTRDKITFLVTKHGKKYPIDYTLEQLEGMTDPHHFFRVNRQFIVSIDAIKEMQTHTKSRIKLILNPPCGVDAVVSTDRSPVFKKWLVGEE